MEYCERWRNTLSTPGLAVKVSYNPQPRKCIICIKTFASSYLLTRERSWLHVQLA